jgi:molecular chaperone DnaK
VVAIDFGTTNSYFCKCPVGQISPIGIDFGTGRDGVPTAILYRRDKTPLIGNWALHEYGEATPTERQSYKLCAQFKPDIADSAQARTQAEDFLKRIVIEAQQQHIALAPAQSQVLFGIPSEATEAYRAALIQVAHNAGYGDARVLDEPKGALLYHLWHKDFSPTEAQQGVLVIDFGGGTCDFAYMQNLEVCRSWGDMALGGRLFDDVFYQWFIQQNPEVADAIRQNGDFYYVYAYLCREAKEFFSLTMARDRSETVNKTIGQYGSLRDMTWMSFVERAEHYRPSDALKTFLLAMGIDIDTRLPATAQINLMEWFKQTLHQGLQDQSVDTRSIGRVILAGGSSQWPFVADIVQGVLDHDTVKIMRSDRPYAAISEGLAILPALQTTFDAVRTRLKKDLPGFCTEQIKPMVEEVTQTYAAEIAADITFELFEKRIRPVLTDFRRRGGTVNQLRSSLSAEVTTFESELEIIIKKRAFLFKTGLPDQVKDVFAQWLVSYGLSVPDDAFSRDQGFTVDESTLGQHVPDLYGPMVDTVGWFVVAAVTSLGTSLSGGAGIALLASLPLGGLIGGVLTGVIAILAVSLGKEKARKLADNWNAPAWMTKRALSETKINKTKDRFCAQITQKLTKQCTALQYEFQVHIKEVAQQQIEALSEITQL